MEECPVPLRGPRAGRLQRHLLTGSLRAGRAGGPRSAVPLGSDLSGLAAAARFHRISGYVLRGVTGLSPEVTAALQQDVDEAVATHLRALADHRRVEALLTAAGVEHLVVKGPVLAEHHHGGPDLRAYRDLDLLVRGRDLRVAWTALAAAGLGVVDRNWDLLTEAVAGEVHLVAPFGTAIDLHWALVFRNSLRQVFPIDVEELFTAARDVAVGTGTMRTLDPADTLLHLCLHAAQSGASRLVWLQDVSRCVEVDRPEWGEVVGRAHRRGLGPVAALVLRRAAATLGTPVSREVLHALDPSHTSRAAMAVADALTPAAGASSRGSPARLLAKSTRGTWAATRSEVGRKAASLRPSGLALLRDPGARPDQGADLLVEAGGDAGRERYFRAVEAEAEPTVSLRL